MIKQHILQRGYMKINYFMPTRILMGGDCVFENRELLKELGKKALVVTGKRSAKENGALADVVKALEANGQGYALYDRVMSNPTVDCVYDAAAFAREENCDWVMAVGGGSPMDAAKAAAALAVREIDKSGLFSAAFTAALPLAAIPTTAGTGSEVTPYAILTNPAALTKMSVAAPCLFPRLAFLDPKYTEGLSRAVTINTAIDALSHAVEGMLTLRASNISDLLAKESIGAIAACFAALRGDPDMAVRRKLLWASTLAGMVIANTGTTAVHSMGYQLTYFRNIDHGRANGLLLPEFLRFVTAAQGGRYAGRVGEILSVPGMGSLEEFSSVLDSLLGTRERFQNAELEEYAERTTKAKNVLNGIIKLEQGDILGILQRALVNRNI
jgi:alcohol dehydrogenase class IV